MNISAISTPTLKPISDQELLSLNRRVHQLWGGLFSSGDSKRGGLTRKQLLGAAKAIFGEMTRRGMHVDQWSPLYVALTVGLQGKIIFGHSAGKRRVAGLIVGLLPEHDIYVEPFAGSAAVFFTKWAVKREVLADTDKQIPTAYRIIKSLSEDDLARLDRMNWTGSRERFKRLFSAEIDPKSDPIGWLHRFLYVGNFSWMKIGFRQDTYHPSNDGVVARSVDRVRKLKPRLDNATILDWDYARVIDQYDSPKTLFYLDPPYAGTDGGVREKDFDEGRFLDVLSNVQGRVLLNYSAQGKAGRTELEKLGFATAEIMTRFDARPNHPNWTRHLFGANYEIVTALERGI